MTKGNVAAPSAEDISEMLDLLRSHIGGTDGRTPVILSDEEIKALDVVLSFKDEVIEQAKYRRARKYLWETYRGTVIGLAAFVGAVSVLLEKNPIPRVIKWLSGN